MDGTATESRPHRFGVADFQLMTEAGVFNGAPRVELIREEIMGMAAISAPHLAVVNRRGRMLALETRGIASVQNPLCLGANSEPQPDVAAPKARADEYNTNPQKCWPTCIQAVRRT